MAGEFGPAFERLLGDAEHGDVRQGSPSEAQLEVLANADLAVWGDQLRRGANKTTAAWRAMMLAPTIEVWEALLAGETVPLSQLDQEWVRRFGVKR